MLMSENKSLIYDKSDVLWVNPYITNQQQQQQQQQKQKQQQQNQQIYFVSKNGKMYTELNMMIPPHHVVHDHSFTLL